MFLSVGLKLIAMAMMCLLLTKNIPINKQGCVYRFFAKINYFLNFGFVINSLLAIQIDMLVPALVNARSLWVDPFKLLVYSFLSFVILLVYMNLAKKLMIKSYFLEKFRKRYGRYPETTEDKREQRIKEMRAEIEDLRTNSVLKDEASRLEELKKERENQIFKQAL